MKFLFFQKIQPSSFSIDRKKKSRKGALTLLSTFMFFVFASLGLSMLTVSQIYLKLSAYKKNSTLIHYASENGIKQSFDYLTDYLSQRPSLHFLIPGKTEELRSDSLNGGKKIIEKVFGTSIPFNRSETWENLIWKSGGDYSLRKIEEEDDYFKVMYEIEVISEGMLKNFKVKKESSLKTSLGILIGNLPLPYIPFLLDKNLNLNQRKEFLEKNTIELIPSEKNKILPKINFSEDELIPQNITPQLSKTLKIKIFYPQDLSFSKLRQAIGLEISNEPIPDGVYLIKDDLGLGGIYVEGDVKEMIMAIEEDFQVLSFNTEKGNWILKFSPSQGKTFFSSPLETRFYDLIPIGIIIVNGEISSLGGGTVLPSGDISLIKEKEIPCILNGINISIIASNKITISSHILHQGVKWEEGIPYIKDSNSQLNIFSAGSDFFSDKQKEGKIIIDKNSNEDIKIQASLTASGNGFSIEGKGKKVHILGSLHVSDYTSNGNTLNLKHDERHFEDKDLIVNAPRTSKQVLYLSFFSPFEWNESQ